MDPLSITARVIAILQLTGTVLGYQQALEQLRSRTDVGNGAQNIKRRLVWKFSKSEVAAILVKDGEAEKPFEHRARERPLVGSFHKNIVIYSEHESSRQQQAVPSYQCQSRCPSCWRTGDQSRY